MRVLTFRGGRGSGIGSRGFERKLDKCWDGDMHRCGGGKRSQALHMWMCALHDSMIAWAVISPSAERYTKVEHVLNGATRIYHARSIESILRAPSFGIIFFVKVYSERRILATSIQTRSDPLHEVLSMMEVIADLVASVSRRWISAPA
jgi:hypothetical protein